MTDFRIHSLDVETACAAPGCSGRGCKHALIPHKGRPVLWGVMAEAAAPVYFRRIDAFNAWLAQNSEAVFVGHKLVFDFKFLITHGAHLRLDQFEDCTALMATASYRKTPDQWLERYEARRLEENKKLPRGYSHREAGKHSLKTLAPYFLGVEPFWENPANHDDEAYLAKDLEYPLRLRRYFMSELREQGTWEFYREKLLPWQRMLLAAELCGVHLDMEALEKKEQEARRGLEAVKRQLDELWLPARQAWEARQHSEVRKRYGEMALNAAGRLKNPTQAKLAAIEARYSELARKAAQSIEPLNLDSPKQMAWLLRDHLGLDIRNFEGKESTGVEVLERLAAEGRQDCALYLKYRELEKRITAFFPTYRDLQRDGVLHCNFNLDITRTGRTSSDTPNLQQCPGDLHALFVARPGHLLITKDLSAIEPRLMAYYSEDRTLFELMASDADFHGYATRMVFEACDWPLETIKAEHKRERDFIKQVDLAVFYGAGANRVQRTSFQHGFNFSLERAGRAVKALRAAWPGVVEFKRSLDAMAEQGPIRGLLGRKRLLAPDEVYMKAFNGLIQGSASDLLLESARRGLQACHARGLEAHLLLTVHDEIVVEAPEAQAEQVDQIFTKAMTDWELPTRWGNVPLKVEGKIARSWSK